MKRLFLSFAILLATTTIMLAQQRVGSAIGLRFGSPTSLSAKHFFNDEAAVEVMAGFRPYFARDYSYSFLGAAYQHHMPLDFGDSDLAGLHWYLGAGGTFQFWKYKDEFFLRNLRGRGDYSTSTIRIAGYAGLQYALEEAPIEFTIDWSPSFTLGTTPFNNFRFGFYTLGVRYVLN